MRKKEVSERGALWAPRHDPRILNHPAFRHPTKVRFTLATAGATVGLIIQNILDPSFR